MLRSTSVCFVITDNSPENRQQSLCEGIQGIHQNLTNAKVRTTQVVWRRSPPLRWKREKQIFASCTYPPPSRLTVLNLLFHCSPLICTSIACMDRRIVMSQSLNCFPSQSQTMFQIDADLPYISNQFLIFWALFFVGPNVHSTAEWLAEETERFSLRLLLIYWFIM